MWELCSGQLLLTVVFECSLSSVLLDPAESCLYAGGGDGSIYTVNLHKQVVMVNCYYVFMFIVLDIMKLVNCFLKYITSHGILEDC